VGGASGPVERDGALFYDPQSLWRAEFQTFRGAPHKKKLIPLRDGDSVEVGKRYDEPGFYVTEGKQRDHATGSLHMAAALDAIERVEADPEHPHLVFVSDRYGGLAAYDAGERVAADGSGEKEKTVAQMGAVMAGVRREADHDPSPTAVQYREAYDAYLRSRTKPNLIKATDAFYAYARAHEMEFGFGYEGLSRAVAVRLQDGGARGVLERRVFDDGAALLARMSALLKEGRPLSLEEEGELLRAVARLAGDVEEYERETREALLRATSTLELAREAAMRLMSPP
jgi:hypothetical protein